MASNTLGSKFLWLQDVQASQHLLDGKTWLEVVLTNHPMSVALVATDRLALRNRLDGGWLSQCDV